MNIVVLAGGISTERDVSIVSGTEVCRALRQKKHHAILLDVYCGLKGADLNNPFPETYDVSHASEYMKSFNSSLEEMKKNRKEFFGPNVLELCRRADFVFLALHGSNGEDGRVQAAFDLFGIPYTGTGSLGSAMAMDKGVTKSLFLNAGVPTPKGVTLEKGGGNSQLSDHGMEFPVVVKPCCGGSSIGVYIVWDQQAYDQALEAAFDLEDTVVVEEFITGREYTVAVIDGKAYPVVEITPKEGFYDYKNKYEAGATIEICPAPISAQLTAQMQKYALKGFEALQMEAYGRLDFIMKDDGQMYCLEANTLPGMTPTSLVPQEALAEGIDFPGLCQLLVEVSMKKYGQQENI